ncbi:MAG: DUF3124 domain-containing protein [Pseudomonadota bacterium]|nr:DUF3124 domain-containing protein [Pseudomonadota bacterium]
MSSNPSERFYRNPMVLSVIAMGSFVLLLLMMFYLGEKLRSISQAGTDSFAIDLTDHQTVYVPVYSHIYVADGESQLLATMLSIRNSDPERPMTITSVRYYGTKGELVQEYVEGTLRLGPLETTEFLVGKRDARGGSGANFIVAWRAEQPVYEPIVEAVMVGGSGNSSVSLKSIGRPLAERVE